MNEKAYAAPFPFTGYSLVQMWILQCLSVKTKLLTNMKVKQLDISAVIRVIVESYGGFSKANNQWINGSFVQPKTPYHSSYYLQVTQQHTMKFTSRMYKKWSSVEHVTITNSLAEFVTNCMSSNCVGVCLPHVYFSRVRQTLLAGKQTINCQC